MATHTTKFTVQIELAQSNSNNRLADGHLAFKGGPLDGCNLGGFTIWQNKRGDGENVTFPARPYVNGQGDKRTFSFIQGDSASLSQLRSLVLEAYRQALQEAAGHTSSETGA